MVIKKFHRQQLESPSNFVQLASAYGLIRSNIYFCRLEKSLAYIDVELVQHMMKFKSTQQTALWCSRILSVIQMFKFPMRRLMNILTNESCSISYSGIWYMLKSTNLQGINKLLDLNNKKVPIKTAKVEFMLYQVAKFLQNKQEKVDMDLNQMKVSEKINLTNQRRSETFKKEKSRSLNVLKLRKQNTLTPNKVTSPVRPPQYPSISEANNSG